MVVSFSFLSSEDTEMILYLSLIYPLSPEDFFSILTEKKIMQLFYEQDEIFSYGRIVNYVE